MVASGSTNLFEPAKYLERRFDKRMRLFGSFISSLSMITWLPIVIYVPALAFNQVTGVDLHFITPLVTAVCVFYTCMVRDRMEKSFPKKPFRSPYVGKASPEIFGFSFRKN